jgi:hypothetical protein
MGIRESRLFRTSPIDKDNESVIDYGPHSGNFLYLLALVGKHMMRLLLEKLEIDPNAKYTHHTVQNALLDIMAEKVKNCIFQ